MKSPSISLCRDLRKDFKWKRERPIGPHKHKPPNLAKWGGVQTMNPDYKRVVSASKYLRLFVATRA